ncbi:MAG: transcriptional regulator [Actinomycetota bacterium]
MTHPSTRIDDVVHQRVRLGILALLEPAEDIDFQLLRDSLELTDGNLSRHLQVLEDAGYLRIVKSFEGKRPRTRVSITREGRTALEAEVKALRELVAGLGNGARKR